jgi:hypothetical protein
LLGVWPFVDPSLDRTELVDALAAPVAAVAVTPATDAGGAEPTVDVGPFGAIEVELSLLEHALPTRATANSKAPRASDRRGW